MGGCASPTDGCRADSELNHFQYRNANRSESCILSFAKALKQFHWTSTLWLPAHFVHENLASRWNCILIRLTMAAFTKLPLVRNGERCKHALHRKERCCFSLWFLILTCGHTLRNLWVEGNAFSCENWTMHCLNGEN